MYSRSLPDGLSLMCVRPRRYKSGRVIIITAYVALVSMVAGVVMGVAVAFEPWPRHLGMSLMRIGALVTIFSSVILLNYRDLQANFSDAEIVPTKCEALPSHEASKA